MTALSTPSEIYNSLQAAFESLEEACLNSPDALFFEQPANKWSKAQHLQHLILSTQTSTAAYALPLFLVRLVGGKPRRTPLSYDELVAKYLQKLNEGGQASGRYLPKVIPAEIGKGRIIARWQRVTQAFLSAFERHRDERILDTYQVPHPLLGKISLRELAYFTIYHTEHHKKAIIRMPS